MGKIDLEYLGACGIYCKNCDIHVAGETRDRKAQEHIANWIIENCDAACEPDKIHCCGCWGPFDEHWSSDCKVLLCARERGVTLCVECESYDGCEMLEAFYKGGDYGAARKTLERILEIGLDAWVAEAEAEEHAS
ncbi:MAG: DUF3795 domain-containing protein [Candidatus Eisenbacteria bacterium]